MGQDYSGMGRIVWVATLVVLALLPPASLPAEAADATETEAARTAVADYFNEGAQPQIQQAAWSSRTIFNVGVHYMGADESAIADEVCPVLVSHGVAPNTKVRVIDINSMGSDPQRWKVVGQATCR
jgi:hypothetical protein